MKKIFLILILILFCITLFAQTIVSTDPENKNVILEEFTGIHCGYCPQGHAIAQGIQDDHPKDVFLINIHTGSYSVPGTGEPDFRTDFGSAVAGQSGLVGYPAGTVNRHLFPAWSQGSGTAMSRGNWSAAANQILGESSYVNVGVEAEINVSTRELTVHVEVYYTGNSPESTNLLNIALLQDNTLGPQAGGGAGNEYIHMHRLVHMITGQWGEEISTTTTGTFVDRTFNYTIPADYRYVPAELAYLKVVAFVTETHQEIGSGNGCLPTLTGFTYSNDASVEDVVVPESACGTLIPFVIIRNEGSNNITSLDITYSVNGGEDQIVNWAGTITPLKTKKIELDGITFIPSGTNTINVSVNSDENNTNNTNSANFDDAPDGTTIVNLELHTDNWGDECTWDIRNSSGTVVYSGGPYGNYQTVTEQFFLDLDCNSFNIYDSYGDGGGAITLEDSEGTTLYYTNGSYGSGESQQFTTHSVLPEVTFDPADGATDVSVTSDVTITFNQPMRKLDDSEITNRDISGLITLTDLSKGDIIYTGTINTEKTIITLDPDEDLPGLSDITVTILTDAIESNFDDTLAQSSVTFTTEESIGVSQILSEVIIYPNPANNIVFITNAENSTVTLTNIYGKSVLKQIVSSDYEEININNLASGLYIIKIELNGYKSERKLIIVK